VASQTGSNMNDVSIACVIVHHRNFPAVLDTVADSIRASIPPEHIVLVDNSESETFTLQLAGSLPEGVTLISTPNRGYGAAANIGIDWALRLPSIPAAILVSSHESRFSATTVSTLLETMRGDPSIGVVGPVFVLPGDPPRVWSTGGSITRFSRRPFHKTQPLLMDTECDWVDGAFSLYRREAISAERFDEFFFMYYEESDLQLRIRARGWKVTTAFAATVEQSTGGAPPYYVGRNAYRFAVRHGSRLRAYTHLAREGSRIAVRGYYPIGRLQAVRAFVKGVRDGHRLQHRA